jgi:hypothetical protein
MKYHSYAVFCCLLIAIVATGLCMGQGLPAPPQQDSVDKIKLDVAKIGLGNKITVIRLDGREVYGSIRRIDATGFQIEEADQRFTVDFKYDELQGVRKGYGIKGYGGKRLPPSNKKWIVTAVVIGAAAISIAIGVAARHHDGF